MSTCSLDASSASPLDRVYNTPPFAIPESFQIFHDSRLAIPRERVDLVLGEVNIVARRFRDSWELILE